MCLAQMSVKGLFEKAQQEKGELRAHRDNLLDIYAEIMEDKDQLSTQERFLIVDLQDTIRRLSTVI